MARKKHSRKKRFSEIVPELTETEQDLLLHMENGYQLETDSLLSDPVLRRLKDDEVIRPLSANRSTVKAMEERGLISPGKSNDPLKIVWRVNKKIRKRRSSFGLARPRPGAGASSRAFGSGSFASCDLVGS